MLSANFTALQEFGYLPLFFRLREKSIKTLFQSGSRHSFLHCKKSSPKQRHMTIVLKMLLQFLLISHLSHNQALNP